LAVSILDAPNSTDQRRKSQPVPPKQPVAPKSEREGGRAASGKPQAASRKPQAAKVLLYND